jgi:hypothetical protein
MFVKLAEPKDVVRAYKAFAVDRPVCSKVVMPPVSKFSVKLLRNGILPIGDVSPDAVINTFSTPGVALDTSREFPLTESVTIGAVAPDTVFRVNEP